MPTPENTAAGPQGKTPRVAIGEYTICRMNNTSVWIEHESGEGGQFSDELFAKAIDAFYKENF